MKNIEKLSDEQLIQLFKNQNIDNELKKIIINEIDRRDLEIMNTVNKEINIQTKIEIIFTSFIFYKNHLRKSSQLLSEGNKKGYKQYWRFFIYGIIFYTIILFLIAKYFFKSQYIK